MADYFKINLEGEELATLMVHHNYTNQQGEVGPREEIEVGIDDSICDSIKRIIPYIGYQAKDREEYDEIVEDILTAIAEISDDLIKFRRRDVLSELARENKKISFERV